MTCKFKDKGVPGRPRKRLRQDHPEDSFQNEDKQTESSSSSSLSPHRPRPAVHFPEAVDPLLSADEFQSLPYEISGNCGFDPLHWEMLENGNIFSAPLETWQNLQQSVTNELEIQSTALGAYASPVSLSQSCKCDEEVSKIIRNLSRTNMSHDTINTIRAGLSLTERLLTCLICYDVSKPPRLTVQNVLLIGQLMFGVTAGYQKYLRWLRKYCSELEMRNETEAINLDAGLGLPPGPGLQMSGDKFYELVTHGLQSDAKHLLVLGHKFAMRQRNRHLVGHESCPSLEGGCRKKEDMNYDPLDLCPQDPVARKLVPCFRIVGEVRGMIKDLAVALV
ncbi:hypothetical protein N7508_007181 [Penicillium antarcticum]|uniref:uncharacterized protein n=1 Tax=Penicillium antarcticum TaxID=416450 RepID=UPI002390B9E2|nr:uncharacterized protein N7508_007181 [Penicillium antarcticum]KAJ5302318.1 hypothetical protein N7508_007181 [Penicillium antarcticum]